MIQIEPLKCIYFVSQRWQFKGLSRLKNVLGAKLFLK